MKTKKKVIPAILAFLFVAAMLIPAFVFGAYAEGDPVFYVDAYSGSDTNDGRSMAKPLSSVNKAIELAKDKDFEVRIIDSYVLPPKFSAHKGRMTICGFDSTCKLVTESHGGYSFGGPVTIRDIKFENGVYAWISLLGNDVELGENITTSGDHQIIAGGNMANEGTSAMNVTVNSGTWNRLVLGPMAANPAHTVKNDAKAHITGGTVKTLSVGGDGWAPDHKGVVFESNVLVKIDGGKVENIKAGTLRYAPTVKGAFMLICNNGVSASPDKTLSTASVKGGKYYVFSANGGYADFVYNSDGSSVAGKIKVTPNAGNYAVITTGENTQKCFEPAEIEISAGNTNITYESLSEITGVIRIKNGENEYISFPADTLEITHSGVISFPDSGFEKEGHLFAGWYSDHDFKTPVKNGDTVKEGTIYARWLPFDKTELSTVGVQIKLSGQGLRFVTRIDEELRSKIISLNDKNKVLSSDDASFNKLSDINYGSVILPEEYLSGTTLSKDGRYPVGDLTYAAKAVPAIKILKKADDHELYTVCVTNLSEADFVTRFTVRPYITYSDASGTQHTIYGDQYSDSLYSAADRIYRSGASNETSDKKDSVIKTVYDTILTKVDIMTNPLANTYRALHNDKKLTVGYLGGSITNGSSASKNGGNIADSFVNRTTAWFEAQFPEAEIEAVNAGISDTATNFGVYRLKDHLMNENGHEMPDLVFVEFTVNDWTYDNGISQNASDISRQIESLVRNIYSINPHADIVFVFTARSLNSASRLEYVKIAESYGIPYVDMGVPLQKLMTERGAANEGEGTYYYTTDNLHPSGIGYGVYFEQIKALLEEHLVKSAVYYPLKRDHAKDMPEQLNRSLWLDPSIIPASEFVLSGSTSKWSGLNSSMFGTSKTTQSSVKVTGDSFFAKGEDAKAEFTFKGTSFGLIFGMNTSGFNIDYQIDGHGWKNATVDTELLSFQKYAHTQIFIFEQELAYGEHKVELKFNPTSDGKVNVQIGGAAVSGADNGFDKIVALSIDDGPRVVDSNKILDILDKYDAHATFFCVGSSINDSTKPVLQRMISEGHEIGNHGNGWSSMKDMTESELMNDYNAVQKKVHTATGVYPKVFRAPGLAASPTMYKTLPLPLFGGSLGVSDWKTEEEVSLEQRIKAMLNQMVDGRVILIHDVSVNAQALDTVIPQFYEKGYKIVTISDLIRLRGYSAPANVNFQYSNFPK